MEQFKAFLAEENFENSNVFLSDELDEELDTEGSAQNFFILEGPSDSMKSLFLEKYIMKYTKSHHSLLSPDHNIIGFYHFCHKKSALNNNSNIIVKNIIKSVIQNCPDIATYFKLIKFDVEKLLGKDNLNIPVHKCFNMFSYI